MLIVDAADQYLDAMRARQKLSQHSADNQRPVFRTLARVASSGHVNDLTDSDVEAWFAAQAHLRRSTIRSRCSALACFARWCVRNGYCHRDWMADVERPKPKSPVPRALTNGQAAALLAAAPDERGRAIVGLMLWCGLRCAEVANLDLADWDRAAALVTVRGKGDKVRQLPLPPECATVLDSYLHERGGHDGPLIVANKWRAGQRLSAGQVSKLVGQWCGRAGIKRAPRDGISAHACRHTCASDVLERCETGMGLVIVRDMLGHEHISTTEIYLRRARRNDMAAAMAGRNYHNDVRGTGAA